ncbi:MAG: hypothetical protein M3P32_05825 [Chloroflexota bacterium]|nr:hypothetical protein [Chloroflexota bacterium]
MIAAAILSVLLLGVIVVFQLALALGAPWGAAAWGGQNPGVLPTRLRIASAVVALVVYPLVIAVVVAAAGLIGDDWLPVDGSVLMWALAGLLGLGALANFSSRSPPERIWGPVALTIAICCAIIALGI